MEDNRSDIFGTVRIGLAFAYMVIATAFYVPFQLVAMKTGLYREGVILKRWHRMMLRGLGIKVRVTGTISAERPLMLVSNHVSFTDIMVLGSVADVTFIAKSELAGWPLLGYLSRLQRTIFIERQRKGKSGEQANEIAGRMASGSAMVLFAEGSTGDGNFLLPFKSTLFGAANLTLAASGEDRVHIQPLALAYTRLHGLPMGRTHRPAASWIGDADLVPHLMGLLRGGAMDAELHFGEPIEFDAASNRKTVTREIEQRVRAMVADALADPLPRR